MVDLYDKSNNQNLTTMYGDNLMFTPQMGYGEATESTKQTKSSEAVKTYRKL
ncbi:MAG: hypothetical protein SNG27_06805 [Rikenellaceae bacterium]